MEEKVVRPERRRLERRQDRLSSLSRAVDERAWSDRRTHCWDLSPECTEERRKRCSAHFVRRNCWDLWGAEYFPPGRKPCCHDSDCSECSLAAAKFQGSVSVYVEVRKGTAEKRPAPPEGGRLLGYCPHLFSVREAAIQRGEGETRQVFRCHRRRGIVLHSTYVTEVCGTFDHRDCNFYTSE